MGKCTICGEQLPAGATICRKHIYAAYAALGSPRPRTPQEDRAFRRQMTEIMQKMQTMANIRRMIERKKEHEAKKCEHCRWRCGNRPCVLPKGLCGK